MADAIRIVGGQEGAVTQSDIDRILSDPKGKEFKDLRDRAAYMYVTGTHPSHLRTFFTRALSLISAMHSGPASMDRRSGSLKLDETISGKLELEDHPMVVKVREYVSDGWRIRVSRGPNARKPFTKVFMHKGNLEHTVQIDGSILDHWD